MKRSAIIAIGIAAVVAETALWHGPLGAGDRLSAKIEQTARAELRRLEMFGVSARLERSPLRRRMLLSGPADDFQQRELVRIIDELPGVSGVRWTTPPGQPGEQVR